MPWKTKQRFILILLGVSALVLAIIVWARSRTADIDLLATGLFFGGLAMILIALPGNWGNGD
jgi:peptidoglycan biosynthesis protein MviN/MurJ (putative lipid II flippase)